MLDLNNELVKEMLPIEVKHLLQQISSAVENLAHLETLAYRLVSRPGGLLTGLAAEVRRLEAVAQDRGVHAAGAVLGRRCLAMRTRLCV